VIAGSFCSLADPGAPGSVVRVPATCGRSSARADLSVASGASQGPGGSPGAHARHRL